MICDKCHGKGYVSNPHLYQVPSWMAYERGYDIPIKCVKCGGSGFILSNAEEIMRTLDIAIKNKRTLSIRELKQIRDVLKNV